MASNRKLFRLLMLHGYRQNETYIYEKTGSIFDNNYIYFLFYNLYLLLKKV
jgi:hypothetical protein